MPTNTYTSRLIDLLDSFNLCQSVTTPTHRSGHILDWVVHRKDDETLLSTTISPTLQSDHYSVLTQLNIFKRPPHAVYIEARNVAAIDLSSFRPDLQAGLDSRTTPSAEQLHRLLQNLLDQHAPATQRKVSSRPPSPWFCAVGPRPGSVPSVLAPVLCRRSSPCFCAVGPRPVSVPSVLAPVLCRRSSPWFCAVGPQLLEAKCERRRAERQWLKSCLEVHKQIFCSACKLVSKIVQQAKIYIF